jgi:hypothetical protein
MRRSWAAVGFVGLRSRVFLNHCDCRWIDRFLHFQCDFGICGKHNPTLSASIHFKGLNAAKSAATFSVEFSLIFPAESVLARREAFADEAHQSQPVRA